jgi:hypothetical protein
MRTRIYIIPCNFDVFNPVTGKNLNRSGEYVESSPFWEEKIKNKEVVQYGPDEKIIETKKETKILN